MPRIDPSEVDERLKPGALQAGVSVSAIADIFGMSHNVVRRKIANVKPAYDLPSGPRYHLKDVAPYLVKPVVDIKDYLRTMSKNDLPPNLLREVWAARVDEQRWRVRGNELWDTDQVMEVFSELFILIKSTMQLWSEDVERNVGLTPAQRTVIVGLCDALQNELRDKIANSDIGKGKRSQAAEIPEEEYGVLDGETPFESPLI